MIDPIESVKEALRTFLRENCNIAPSKTQDSQKKHLEIWTTRKGNRALGLEFDHSDIVNIWLTSLNTPQALPDSVKVTRKTPIGSKWTDANSDGANSNLSGYEQFRTRPITRLGVTTVADAVDILTRLTR